MNKNEEIEKFYTTRKWRNCRTAYAQSKGGLCERCLSKGLIEPGTQVHHIRPLTGATVHIPSIALSWENMILLCDRCHEEQHGKHRARADQQTGHVSL